MRLKAKAKKEEKLEEVTVTSFPVKDNVKNVLYVRLTQAVFKRVYAIAKENDTNMSEVARLCIETKLNDVQKLYVDIGKLKSGYTN